MNSRSREITKTIAAEIAAEILTANVGDEAHLQHPDDFALIYYPAERTRIDAALAPRSLEGDPDLWELAEETIRAELAQRMDY